MPALSPVKSVPVRRNRLAPLSAARLARGTSVLALAALLAACGQSEPPAGGAPGGMPAPEVGVITVTPGDVGLLTELPGRLEASRVAQVRARAAGILQERLFREGSDVKAGQALFRIDAAPYAAALQSAQASLARSQANLSQAAALAERYAPLVKENAISQQEYASAVAAQKQAEADVAAGKAAVQTASINLGYARVNAPISGRIGRALVTEGALVGQGEATQLAVIQQINPMYVNFTQSASEVYKLRKAMDSGQLKGAGAQAASVQVVMEDGSVYEQPGRLLFTDLTVDAATGQVMLRAEVPNPKGTLLPGLYVRVRLEQATAGNAITLPQQAVTRSAQGDKVSVVGADGKVVSRTVKVGGEQGGRWVIVDGLQAGEQVMVDGFQKLQMMPPGTPVKAVPWQAPGSAPAAKAPAAQAADAAK
ncbi:MAG: efflux RND transporter periplasmic adaptor subunit [Hydrogenophaga sp.]|jgi:membrane fusion protein, multidrug efflux system|uniref:efflux RND transporter periplasmic adaptor subunit n=1 Tax=Hydrogenophaga sp. TaxID=1904254 RepID=UPI002627B1DC|nr:efflux RND transporter periplasmic adaptor subunit [Hydrogenophaga sp.]MCV0440061.1 efflux RND transporter periplasmic adaptor subunit [Hydrogenophaga sp.]